METVLKLFFSFLFVLMCARAGAQQARTAEMSMRHDLSVLSSDSLLGREAGSRGEQMASRYIAGRMKEMGLTPGGDSAGSYLSHFVMNYPVIFKEGLLKVNNVKFNHSEEFGATDLSAGGSIKGPLVFFDHTPLSLPGDAETATANLNGKIVVFDINPGNQAVDKSQIVRMTSKRCEFFALQGAKGVILHNSARAPHEDALFGSTTTVPLNIPVIYVARLPYERLRRQRKPECTLSITIDRTSKTPANIVGVVDRNASKTVIVGAHYDHLGASLPKDSLGKTAKVFNGADDNGSGTVALLELAKWASGNPDLKYNYIFVAFSAEEKGLLGSKAYAADLDRNKDQIAYMLNLDMVGRLGCQGDTVSVLGVASSPVWTGLLDTIPHPDFDLKKINGAPAFSDHAPFVKKEIPVVYFTTGTHKEYHTPADDFELINFGGLAEIVNYIKTFFIQAEKLPDIPFQKMKPLQQTRAYMSVL